MRGLRLEQVGGRRGLELIGAAAGRNPVARLLAIARADHKDLFQVAAARPERRDARLQLGIHDDRRRARIVDVILEILRFGDDVDRDGHGADLHRSDVRFDERRPVRHEEDDTVLDLDAGVPQHVARAVDARQQLAVGDDLITAVDGDAVSAPFVDVAIHQYGGHVEGLRNVDIQPGGHPSSRACPRSPAVC